MKSETRFKLIERLLNDRGSLSVKELAELTNVSEATIRRDLIEMQKRSLLERLWGGAKIIEKNPDKSIPEFGERYSLRFSMNTAIKERLAQYANNLIPNNSTIFIDAGSTLAKMFNYLSASNVTVVTNCIFNIDQLADKNIKTFLPKGYLNFNSAAILSMDTIMDLGAINYDFAFIGSSGIDPKTGFSTNDRLDARMKEVIIRQSNQTYVLADSSKFHERRTYTFANINDILLITDKMPDFPIDNIIIV